ncbi:hypothetical protein ACET3Z_024945 [Daucus carota]
MATDMEIEKDVTTQLEDKQPEAVEIENKELLKAEELSHQKDTADSSSDAPNVNDVEMTAAEHTVGEDGRGDVPAAAANGTVTKDECGDQAAAAAEDSVVKGGCGDIPAVPSEDAGVKNGCGDVPAVSSEDAVVKEGCGNKPSAAEDSVVKDGCPDIPAATGTTVSAVDSIVEASGNDDVCGRTEEDDKKNHDVDNQSVAVAVTEDNFPEIKEKNKKDGELTNRSGMDVSNEALVPGSGEENGSKEEEIINGERQRDSALNDGKKMDASTDTMSASGLDVLQENGTKEGEMCNKVTGMEIVVDSELKGEVQNPELDARQQVRLKTSNNSFLGPDPVLGDETGTAEERAEFIKELETFHKEKFLEFKHLRFYGEPLNLLKLWRSVIKLGGYEQVTSCKLWRQVGESFNPPKTCTTVSWTFRCFYEKSLLEYEKHKMRSGELPYTDASFPEPCRDQAGHNQAAGPGRARRDSAARAMQGWHSQRLPSNGDVGDQIIKDKDSSPVPKREKQLKSIGLLKRKTPPPMDDTAKVAGINTSRQQLDTTVVDIGTPADWVKINVQKTKDCFEIYALVPGLLREEVRVQSDPAGHLIISGEPENIDNPWGVVPFRKVVSLPSRIDPQQTSALVTLHGQLFVRVPFEQSNE